MSILDSNDMQKERNAHELCEWVTAKLEEVSSASRQVKEDSRLKRGQFKKFKDELLPLRTYMSHCHGVDLRTTCKHILGNQPYDARLFLRHEEDIHTSKIEITYAIDGHQESLRMEKLNKEGHVSLSRSLLPPGSGKPGSRDVDYAGGSATTSSAQAMDLILLTIVKAADAKLVRHKDYEQGTILLVGFEDHLLTISPYKHELDLFAECLDGHIATLLRCYSDNNFSGLHVCGAGNIFYRGYSLKSLE